MNALKRRFLPSHQQEEETQDEAELKRLFQQRYADFRQLLAANVRAMDIMNELERVLRGDKPFGIVFIRSTCTQLLTAVFRIIRSLNRLAPQSYNDLFTVYDDIEIKIERVLEQRKSRDSSELVISLDRLHAGQTALAGSKMANLGELKQALGLEIPSGFVITTSAYLRFLEYNTLQDEINSRLQSSRYDLNGHALDDGPDDETQGRTSWLELSSQIQSLIKEAPLPPELSQAMQENFAAHFAKDSETKLAVRSSALGEDVAHSSFAGQYRSLLNIDSDQLPRAYKDVVASKYTLQGISYRYHRGIRDDSVLMGVGCLEMISTSVSGIMYTQNPTVEGDQAVIITAVYGLPKGAVDGSLPTDTFVLERNQSLDLRAQYLAHKTEQLLSSPSQGVVSSPVPTDQQDEPCLSMDRLQSLAQAGLKIEAHFGLAQDIEWAITEDDRLIFLQTRPLSLGHKDTPQEQSNLTPLLQGGLTASPGVGSGEVFHVENETDLVQFPEHAVLVSSKSLPQWAPALARAGAMITEHGSVAGHLANIAREFGVPSIVGLQEAASQLSNGQMVTVDADACKIYSGQTNGGTAGQRKPHRPIQGTPVYDLLQRLSEHILPLHLVDPEAPEFRARNCRTLHDITRFAHEKAVQEMFEFGVQHQFSPRAGKQLRTTVPMQWWVLNLEDGFREEVNGRYVHLSQIQSVPMLALWRGITAFPWQGPPSLDRRGFVSVLYQATINPELNETAATNFKVKNYFMISKEFCNLFSRFGFHFSSVEALVGTRIRENYIRFQFRGGAADYFRRVKRTQFVGALLENYGFHVRLREDALVARMDNYEADFLIQRLKIVGHLIIHTRQLDMIMDNDAIAEQYRERMQAELEEVKDLKA
ncbi:PEP/pyruvate-binding domain-containing protein [Desulfovermiculus halophilus]|uniref:PEP/pyruvate-binding domain-containing protein n=1 Tax=Desulfovermiculus halophilus TaxID=339722 RepID=UPI000555B662|nr:PEP/pyruvate-binding domain-containing protein [Desulfovermiculus halophilus]